MRSTPSSPRIFNKIQDSIANGDGVAAVADIVESDIAIATMVLRTANSAFYGLRSPANSVCDAVSRLGSVVVSGIALNAELAANAPPEIVAELEALNSIAASVARVVRKLTGTECPQASLAALLRDIGVAVLQLNMTEAYRPVQELFNLTGHGDEDSELRSFGVTNADIGACVLRRWKVDALVVEAVQFRVRRCAPSGPGRPDHPAADGADPPRSSCRSTSNLEAGRQHSGTTAGHARSIGDRDDRGGRHRDPGGNLLVKSGSELTETLIQRLRNFDRSHGVVEPIVVMSSFGRTEA